MPATRVSHHWDCSGDLLIHYQSGGHAGDWLDPRDSLAASSITEVVHHGWADAPSVRALMADGADPHEIADEIRRLHREREDRRFPASPPPRPPAAVLLNGREVRETDAGTYEVQPARENGWVECDDLNTAIAIGESSWK